MTKKRLKFKHITKNEGYLDYVKEQLEKGSSITDAVRDLCDRFGLEYSDNLRRRFSERLSKNGVTEKTSAKYVPLELTDEFKEATIRSLPKSKYYLISTAQAKTDINKNLWVNMKAFADYIGAEILIQPSRYKSPTSLEANERVKQEERGNHIWSPEIRNHLYATDVKLNNYLSVLFALKIQPTAKMPLSSTNGFTGESTAIIPHNKQHLESMPVLPDNPHKLLLTTGTITEPNFTDTKIGYESQWAHTYGFVLAEIVDEEKFFVHQVSSDDSGEFYFLDYKVSDGAVTKSGFSYPAIVFGDIHYGETDETAYNTSIKLAKRLDARNTFLHDVFNGHSISHHEKKSPLTLIKREERGQSDLEQEINGMLDELSSLKEELYFSKIHIVESNHPLWINQWLNSNDWRNSPNKKAYLKYAWMVASEEIKDFSVVNHLIKEAHPTIEVYTENDSLKIKGFEMLLHGHRGNASSKGSVNQYKNLSTKSISAHSHVPRRYNGALSAGTLTILNPDYVKGLSAWMHSNVVITPNGRATHIHIINGEYTTL